MRHHAEGPPRRVLRAATATLAELGLRFVALSPILDSTPLGPSRRRYANAAALVACDLAPEALLGLLQSVERRFGRVRRGQRWSARVLDLDIVLWSGGVWSSPRLAIPHPRFRRRPFVLAPAAAIAPDWRDPATGLTLRQLHSRLLRPRPRDA